MYQIFYLMGATVLHATIGFAMYDCDMMTGDCSFGEYLPWDGSIREIHKEVGLPYDGSEPIEDGYMRWGYTRDACLKYGWFLHFFLFHVYFYFLEVRKTLLAVCLCLGGR